MLRPGCGDVRALGADIRLATARCGHRGGAPCARPIALSLGGRSNHMLSSTTRPSSAEPIPNSASGFLAPPPPKSAARSESDSRPDCPRLLATFNFARAPPMSRRKKAVSAAASADRPASAHHASPRPSGPAPGRQSACVRRPRALFRAVPGVHIRRIPARIWRRTARAPSKLAAPHQPHGIAYCESTTGLMSFLASEQILRCRRRQTMRPPCPVSSTAPWSAASRP
jgi:hypothetical protein